MEKKNPTQNGGAGGLSSGQADFTSHIKLLHAQNHNQTSGFTYVTLNELLSMAKSPRVGAKESAPCFAPHDGNGKTRAAAAAAMFHVVIIDFDDGNHDADSIKNLLDGMAYIAWTSSSHTLAEPRWKAVVPLNRATRADEWLPLAQGASLLYGSDVAQARIQQISYVPNILSKDAPYEFIDALNDAPLLSPTGELAKAFVAAFEASREQAATQASPKPQSAPKGSTDLIGMVNRAYDVRSVLEANGYKRRGKLYLAPNSSSGVPGVHILVGSDGRERVYSHHTNDVLANGFSHDSFDLLVTFRFHGNVTEAVRVLANELDPEGQAQRQREYMAGQEAGKGDKRRPPFDLGAFSKRGDSRAMRDKMQKDVFVMNGIAIRGQITALYAKPNTGKTLLSLWMLFEAVKAGNIQGDDVFYINADDSYVGALHKLELCEQHDVNMLIPGEKGFHMRDLPGYLQLMADEGSATGKVLLLDTLKKITDLMDKKLSAEFMRVAREFVHKGGTLILLAHTNKNRDNNGRVVAGGTSDIIDDADCAYLIDHTEGEAFRPVEGSRARSVEFSNIKARGAVEPVVRFTYDGGDGTNYRALMDSVRRASLKEDAAQVAKRLQQQEWEADIPIINALKLAIMQGHVSRWALVKAACADTGLPKRQIIAVLDRRTSQLGGNERYPFQESRGDKNARVYSAWEVTRDEGESFSQAGGFFDCVEI